MIVSFEIQVEFTAKTFTKWQRSNVTIVVQTFGKCFRNLLRAFRVPSINRNKIWYQEWISMMNDTNGELVYCVFFFFSFDFSIESGAMDHIKNRMHPMVHFGWPLTPNIQIECLLREMTRIIFLVVSSQIWLLKTIEILLSQKLASVSVADTCFDHYFTNTRI